MLTIFTIPKSFEGHIGIIQKNAIQSWKKLSPGCEIIIFGDDRGVEEFAKSQKVLYMPDIPRNQFGTPLLSSAFKIAKEKARNEILVYINSDIILTSGFIEAISSINLESFLISGRRWDIDIEKPINFDDLNWEKGLLEGVEKRGVLHGYSGIDYLIFPKKSFFELPDFAVGRPGWDSWFVYRAKFLRIPVIDATEEIKAIHQNHKSIYKDKLKENKQNFDLAGGLANVCTLREADFILRKKRLEKPFFPRIIFSKLALFYPWRLLLSIKRRLQK